MPCQKCGCERTIRAHLIARVFCREIQGGQSHATGVTSKRIFHATQSGTFDNGILCAACDGRLGKIEEYAAGLCQAIRTGSANAQFGVKTVGNVDKDLVRRFCAALLWKYSITSDARGRIHVFGVKSDLGRIAFGELTPPPWLDVAMLRLRMHEGDDAVFAYRAPFADRRGKVRLYRFMVGGVLFFVKTQRRQLEPDILENLWLSNRGDLRFGVVPARPFEEFSLAKDMIHSQPALSAFLGKQDALAARHK